MKYLAENAMALRWIIDEVAELTDEQWNWLEDRIKKVEYAKNNETQIAEMKFARDERGNFYIIGYKVNADGSRGDMENINVDKEEDLDVAALKMARKIGMGQ